MKSPQSPKESTAHGREILGFKLDAETELVYVFSPLERGHWILCMEVGATKISGRLKRLSAEADTGALLEQQ